MKKSALRDTGGSASIEMAASTVMLITVALASYDLHTRIEAHTSAAHVAATIAHFLSLEPAPELDEVRDIAVVLQRSETRAPNDMVLVISAFNQEDSKPDPTLLWSDNTIRFGDSTRTEALAQQCKGLVDGSMLRLPNRYTPVEDGETVVTGEVCLKLTRQGSMTGLLIGDVIYRMAAIPMRNAETMPAVPITLTP